MKDQFVQSTFFLLATVSSIFRKADKGQTGNKLGNTISFLAGYTEDTQQLVLWKAKEPATYRIAGKIMEMFDSFILHLLSNTILTLSSLLLSSYPPPPPFLLLILLRSLSQVHLYSSHPFFSHPRRLRNRTTCSFSPLPLRRSLRLSLLRHPPIPRR